MRGNRRNTGGSDGFITIILFAIIAMPILGIVLLTQNNKADRRWGAVLTIAGIIIWFLIGLAGS